MTTLTTDRKLFSFTSIALAGLMAAGVFVSPLTAPPAHAGLFSISEKEEIQAGQQVAAQARKEYGGSLPAKNPMSVRVREIGKRFAGLSERKGIPYTYEVLNNEKVLNAFAAPGGPVFVTKKLVETTANDAELAYVLGHETGHIDREHIVKAVEKQQKVGLGVGILGAIFGRGGSNNIFGLFSNVAFTVWTRGYSRDQETEADIVGTRWMSQLGYDPRAAISMLGKLGGGSSGVSRYLATHPDPKDRQQRIEKLIQDEKLVDVAKRSGGPFLTDKDLPRYDYQGHNSGSVSQNSDDGFGKNDIYSPGNNDEKLEFGAPLLVVASNRYNVIMAPVGGFARWANANVDIDDRDSKVATVSRGHYSIRMRRDSRGTVINGKNETLSAPAKVYNGLLYAPLGSLAEGVGAQATLTNDNSNIIVRLDGKQYYSRVPQ